MAVTHPRELTLFRSSLLTVMDYRCAGHMNAEQESSQGYEIVLTRSGAYQRRDSHGTFLADPNQILFYNLGEPFDITHPVQGGDTSTVFLFAPALLREIVQACQPKADEAGDRLFTRSHITFKTRLQAVQYRLIRLDLPAADPLALEEDVIALAAEIIRALYAQAGISARRVSHGTQRVHAEQAHQVRVFLNSHLQSPLQLEHIAAAVHLSPFHLSRIFKQHTGMTLHQYVVRLRLFNAAERMLDHPTAHLDRLALDYGFSNHGHFSTAFRQTFGVNPSDLRGAQLRRMSKILKA